MPTVQHGKSYFKIKAPFDASEAFIPKGTPVAPEVMQWKVEDINTYLRLEGFRELMEEAAFAEFRKALRKYPNGFKEDYTLIKGVPPVEPVAPKVVWLHHDDDPPDLVFPNIPFLKVTLPQEGKPGKDVYGRPVEPKSNYLPPALELRLPEEVMLIDDELYISNRAGQINMRGNSLYFSSTYLLDELGKIYYQKRTWPCSLSVNSDLEGTIQWEIEGDLEVKGHWNCPNIVVHGNAFARSGIHTNNLGCVKVFGNFTGSYVQMTTMGVLGNVLVEGSILQSELRIGGNLTVRGNPGTVMGSSIDLFGYIISNKTGSDSGRRTKLRIHQTEEKKSKKSRIASLAKGTEMLVEGKSWVQEEDGFFTE